MIGLTSYSQFLKSKAIIARPAGIKEPQDISEKLFPFQRACEKWALQRGKAALFLGTGLGKTPIQGDWAAHVEEYTQKPVLILAPLAVSHQTIDLCKNVLGLEIKFAEHGAQIADRGIYVTNYQKLERFHSDVFGGVVWDESSILKSVDGKTRAKIIEAFAGTPFRLACTATPAPNDYMELGQHAEALSVMKASEMLATFFVHDGGETQKWRLKRHAEKGFWQWLASWCICAQKPSDIGFSDDGFILPKLTIHDVIVDIDANPLPGELFALPARTLRERQGARRISIDDRVKICYELVNDIETGGSRNSDKSHSRAKGRVERKTPGNVCDRSDPEGTNAKESAGMAKEQSSKAEISPPKAIQSDARAMGGDVEAAELPMSDLRLRRHEQAEHLPAGGSLPQDGSSSGSALPELQSRPGQDGGQPGMVAENGELPALARPQWIVWCGLNAEQDALAKLLGNRCVSIQGSTPDEEKVRLEKVWRSGQRQVMITKCTVFGYGLNWQHCANMAFLGLSDSWEQIYQAVRRAWRYGQKNPVNVYVILSSQEQAVLQNIKRKEADAQRMQVALVEHMSDLTQKQFTATVRTTTEYKPKKRFEIPEWL